MCEYMEWQSTYSCCYRQFPQKQQEIGHLQRKSYNQLSSALTQKCSIPFLLATKIQLQENSIQKDWKF
jgi:hypothetical protein